ncbi:hypothetical protein ACJ72_01452 [Emergomyces africanus]|uniref:Complex 1 LYR protein domain-containing protein n=1 Tax=Emergomyces africanus TaxID=1955775 RepID=A0A1B7P5K0_9EURO|nr:hypothetical protein ACJ72_01452 [Emergomyces africanus]
MRWSVRLFSAAGQLPRSPLKQTISLEHFVQRKRALGLWRDIVRATNTHYSSRAIGIPQSSARDEMRSFARHEFERNKGVTDLVPDLGMSAFNTALSLYLVHFHLTGKTEFDAMRRYIDELAA